MMRLSIRKPSSDKQRRFVDSLKSQSFTYVEQGSTLEWSTQLFQQLPNSVVENGYLFQFRRASLGNGRRNYERARQSLQSGDCFDLKWVEYLGPSRLSKGTEFGLLAHTFGIWSLNGCRVLFCDEVEDEESLLFSLVLGTLETHAAIGEERLGLLFNRITGEVDFLIGSFSKPVNRLVAIGAPVLRFMQNRFAIDSASRLRSAIEPRTESHTAQLSNA